MSVRRKRKHAGGKRSVSRREGETGNAVSERRKIAGADKMTVTGIGTEIGAAAAGMLTTLCAGTANAERATAVEAGKPVAVTSADAWATRVSVAADGVMVVGL